MNYISYYFDKTPRVVLAAIVDAWAIDGLLYLATCPGALLD